MLSIVVQLVKSPVTPSTLVLEVQVSVDVQREVEKGFGVLFGLTVPRFLLSIGLRSSKHLFSGIFVRFQKTRGSFWAKKLNLLEAVSDFNKIPQAISYQNYWFCRGCIAVTNLSGR